MSENDEFISVVWLNFKNGDDNALTTIYHKYSNALYSYGLKIVNDEHLVKDSIQEVFIQLINKRKTLLITPKIHIYLFKSLRNQLFEKLRDRNRKQNILESLSFNENIYEKHAEEILIDSEERKIVQDVIVSAVNQLTNRQQEVIFLKYTEDLDYDEIAQILNIDIESVRTLVYRSLKSLKKAIKIK
jgi:RNA polymerase sigma factor (sigma-70 family)